MGTELTASERHCLTAYEAVIAQGMESFIDVGNALCQIRDGELYRETHRTFAEYVGERWSMKRSHAYRLMFAAKTVPVGAQIGWKPTTESQVRELNCVPDERLAFVVSRAVELFGASPTAAQIRATVTNIKEQTSERSVWSQKRDERVYKHYTGNFVYVLVNNDLSHAKIGFTTDVIKRHQAASTFTIWPVSYLCVVPGDKSDEAATHKEWDYARKHGEWFHADQDLIDAAQVASMQMGSMTMGLFSRGLAGFPIFHNSHKDLERSSSDCCLGQQWRIDNDADGTDCDSSLVINNTFRHYVHFKTCLDHAQAFRGVEFKSRRIGRMMAWFHETNGIVFGSCHQATGNELGGPFRFKRAAETVGV